MGDAADELYNAEERWRNNNMNRDEYVRVTCEFKTRTRNAILISQGGNDIWIPRTLLSWSCDKEVDSFERGSEVEVKMYEWKAEQEGLEYQNG